MGDKCNCYRFSPRDSLSGAVAQIADYLSKHPGWNETELRAFVDGLISSAGVETFNGRSGNVTLNKDDVNNLLIANCYFAEADETIESIDVLALYKLGIRIVFTQYSSEIGGYTLAYGIEYYPTTDTAKAYLFSSGSGGVGAVVSVNGKTGTVVLKASDILMNNGDSVENAVSNTNAIANAAYSPNNPPPYPVNSVNSKTGSVMLKVVDVSNGDSVDDNAYIFIDETENYPDIIAPDSNKLGGQIPSYYATADSVNSLKNDKLDKTATAADSSKLGGKAPEYYLQPRNLLDNSDFRNPVNQRGFTGTNQTTESYGIDRWLMSVNTDGRITLKDGGLELVNANLFQRIESKRLDSDKPYTMALSFADGTTRIATTWVDFEYEPGVSRVVFYNITGTIIGAALYEGTYTADTLPPYVPKGYAAELAECRRYFERLGTTFSERIGTTVYVVSGAKSFVCSLQCSRKRISHPSVSISDIGNYRLLLKDATNASTYSAASISSIDDITTQEPFISFRVNMVDAITQNSWIQLQRSDGATAAYIDVFADL